VAATGADNPGRENWPPKRCLPVRMHPSLRGIPDLVLEGDGYTLEFIGPTLLCVDIRKLNHLKSNFLQECSNGKLGLVAAANTPLPLGALIQAIAIDRSTAWKSGQVAYG